MTVYQPGQTITITQDTTLYAVWMGIPGAMDWRIWDGDDSERFRYTDMARIQSNLTTMAGLISGMTIPSFTAPTRSDAFDYTVAQNIETAIGLLVEALGMTVEIQTNWSVLRAITYRDFERWESQGWAVYKAMGGTSERTDAA